MSGRKQHYIPQLLLREFGTPSGKSVQVQVCRYSKDPFLAATDGVGAEREFYSKVEASDSQSLDDRITSYENHLAEVLRDFHSLERDETVSPTSAAEFVTHLVTRNDQFRQSVTAAAKSIFAAIIGSLCDEDRARKLLGVSRTNPGEQLSTAINEAIQERQGLLRAAGLKEEHVRAWMLEQLDTRYSEFHSDISAASNEVFRRLSAEVGAIAADSQKSVLEKDLIPEKWVEKLSCYVWSIRRAKTPIILPDCIAIAIDRENKKVPLILVDGEANYIIVPIGKSRFLLGSKRSADPIKIDPRYLNRHLARCSWDFFVGPLELSNLMVLGRQIRRNSEMWIHNTVTKVVT